MTTLRQPDLIEHLPHRSGIYLFRYTATSPVRWRVTSANRRELARGTGAFDSEDACRLAIKHLHGLLHELEQHIDQPTHRTWTYDIHPDTRITHPRSRPRTALRRATGEFTAVLASSPLSGKRTLSRPRMSAT